MSDGGTDSLLCDGMIGTWYLSKGLSKVSRSRFQHSRSCRLHSEEELDPGQRDLRSEGRENVGDWYVLLTLSREGGDGLDAFWCVVVRTIVSCQVGSDGVHDGY